MSKRGVFTTITALPPHVTREVVLDFLHNYEEMIDLNPLVKDRHPIRPPLDADVDEEKCIWYQLTDKISYLPGGLATGDVSYTCVFNNLPNGIQTHCRAPMGVDIRDRWTLGGSLPGEARAPVEMGLDAPPMGLYIREEVDLRCNMLMMGFVKKTLKKAHGVLVDKLADKALMVSSNERGRTPSIAAQRRHQHQQYAQGPMLQPYGPGSSHQRSVSQPNFPSPQEPFQQPALGLGISQTRHWSELPRAPVYPERRTSPTRHQPHVSPPQMHPPQMSAHQMPARQLHQLHQPRSQPPPTQQAPRAQPSQAHQTQHVHPPNLQPGRVQPQRVQLISNGDIKCPLPDPLRIGRPPAVLAPSKGPTAFVPPHQQPARSAWEGRWGNPTARGAVPTHTTVPPILQISAPTRSASWDVASPSQPAYDKPRPQRPILFVNTGRQTWNFRYTKPPPPKMQPVQHPARSSWDGGRLAPPKPVAEQPRLRASSMNNVKTAGYAEHPDYPSMNPYENDSDYDNDDDDDATPPPLRIAAKAGAVTTATAKVCPVLPETRTVAHPVVLQPGMAAALSGPWQADWGLEMFSKLD